MDNINIFSLVLDSAQERGQLLLNILPAETIIILEEPIQIEEAANLYLARSENPSALFNWTDIYSALSGFTQLHICRFGTADEDFIRLNIKSTQQYQSAFGGPKTDWAGHKESLEQLVAKAKNGWRIFFTAKVQPKLLV